MEQRRKRGRVVFQKGFDVNIMAIAAHGAVPAF